MASAVVISTGVVSVGPREGASGSRGVATAYIECSGGRAVWLEGGVERSVVSAAPTALLGVVGSSSAAEGARSVTTAVARVLAKLHPAGVPRDPVTVLSRYLAQIHTRMYWAARAASERPPGASVAAVWVVGASVAWAEVGECALWRLRRGVLEQLAAPWPEAAGQRLVAGSRELGDDTAIHLVPGRNTGVERVQDGDRFLLATQGVGEAIGVASIAAVLRGSDHPQGAAVAVVDRARSCGEDGALSVIVAFAAVPELDEDDEPTVEVIRDR